jgi:hypothetical protein
MSFSTIIKDPDAILPYSINWASEDGTNDGGSTDTGWLQGDTIATSTWVISGNESPLSLTQDSENESTTIATIVLSAGTASIDYTVTNHIVTAAGYEDDRSILVKVRDR